MTTQFDAIVIGAGQSGGPLAGAFARAGRRTALIEREHVGGTCINRGCTPTKTMVASARVAYLARRGGDYGVAVGPVSVDLAAVRRRKREIVESFRASSERRIAEAGAELIRGEASFVDARTIRVRESGGDTRTLGAELIILNTGGRPARPRLPGLGEVPFLDSTSIMELDEVPPHLLVLGGGYIGLEFAQMYRRFGSEVTVVQHGLQLLGREDPDVAEAVAAIMHDEGLDLRLETEPVRVDLKRSGEIHLTVEGPQGVQTLAGTHLLVATGRVPNTGALDLGAAGVATDDHGFITVNDCLETSVPGIYAMGDVKGGPAFTHISYDDFRILRRNLLEGGSVTTDGRLVPYVVFIDPQLGRVGMTEAEARRKGRRIGVACIPMSYVARAVETDETRGFMKAVVDEQSGEILGCAVLGIEGGELMAMLEIAMMAGLPYTTLRDGIFAHPTLSESLNILFSAVEFDRGSFPESDRLRMTLSSAEAAEGHAKHPASTP